MDFLFLESAVYHSHLFYLEINYFHSSRCFIGIILQAEFSELISWQLHYMPTSSSSVNKQINHYYLDVCVKNGVRNR